MAHHYIFKFRIECYKLHKCNCLNKAEKVRKFQCMISKRKANFQFWWEKKKHLQELFYHWRKKTKVLRDRNKRDHLSESIVTQSFNRLPERVLPRKNTAINN